MTSEDRDNSAPRKPSQSSGDNTVNPWKTLSREVRYENAWIEVAHHEVKNPAGNPGIYGTVHFKNTAIGIVPLDDAHNTWLVGQYRFPLQRYSWEIPEGGGEKTASTLDSAKRELREETGISAGKWSQILDMDMSNSVSDERAVVYVARDLEFGDAQPEDTEELAIRKLPFVDALQMVMDGEITDALAIAAILKTARLIDSGAL